jgi:hypothetical protein
MRMNTLFPRTPSSHRRRSRCKCLGLLADLDRCSSALAARTSGQTHELHHKPGFRYPHDRHGAYTARLPPSMGLTAMAATASEGACAEGGATDNLASRAEAAPPPMLARMLLGTVAGADAPPAPAPGISAELAEGDCDAGVEAEPGER